ncbi:MAG TPA: hypothetical protein VF555_08150 [Variovorax sp.]
MSEFERLLREADARPLVGWDLSRDSGEGAEPLAFADIGAFAWYLKQVPYVCPEFSIDGCRPALDRLYRRMESGEALTMLQKLFWVNAVRPG